MKGGSNGQNKTFIPSTRLIWINSIFLFFIFIDFYITNLVFVLNTNRTISSGIYQALWVQFPIVFILLILNRYELKYTQEGIKERIGIDLKSPSKAPLFQEVGEDISGNEDKSYAINDLIFYLISVDVLFAGVFVFYGLFFAEILLFTAIAIQGYFLVPAIFMYIIYTRIKFPDKVEKEDNLIIDQRTIFTKLSDLTPRNKKKFLFSVICLTLAISMLWSVPLQEDYHNNKIAVNEAQDFTTFTTHHISYIDGQVNILGTMDYPNIYDRTFPKLTHLKIDNDKVVSSEIIKSLGRVNESIIDHHYSGDQVYMLMHNNDFYYFDVLRYDLSTGEFSNLTRFQVNSTISSVYYHQMVVSEDQFILISSPYRPDIWGPSSVINFIPRLGTQEQQSLTFPSPIWESISYDGMIYFNVPPFTQQLYFEQTTVLLPLTNNTITATPVTVIESPQLESTEGYVSPNGFTYHEIDGELYYISSNNIYSLTSERGISQDINVLEARYRYRFRSFTGMIESNNHLIAAMESRILFIEQETMTVDQTIHALNSGYQSSYSAPLSLTEDEILSMSTSGALFSWDRDISNHKRHETYINTLQYGSGVVYLIGTLIMLTMWKDQYKLKINTSKIN